MDDAGDDGDDGGGGDGGVLVEVSGGDGGDGGGAWRMAEGGWRVERGGRRVEDGGCMVLRNFLDGKRAVLGIEPRTSRTRSENHATRPNSHALLHCSSRH